MPDAEVAPEDLERELNELVDKYLVPSSKIRIINLKYFAQYSPDAGFKFAIDGMHNMPDKGIFVTLYYINHPDRNQEEVQKDPLRMQINSSFDWSSPLYSPAYIEGYVHYKKIEPHKGAHMVLDVRRVKHVVKKEKEYYDLEPYAWTILPLFTTDGYVNSGIYQVPLFKKGVSASILKGALIHNSPWKHMEESLRELDLKTKKPALEYLSPASIIVRLIDGQREVMFFHSGPLSGTF